MRKSRPRPPSPRRPKLPAPPRRRRAKLPNRLPNPVRSPKPLTRPPSLHPRPSPRPTQAPPRLRRPIRPQVENPRRRMLKAPSRLLTRPTTRSGSLAMPVIGFRRRGSRPVFGPMIARLGGFNKAANAFGDDGRRSGNALPPCAAEVPCCDRAAGSRLVENAYAPQVRRELPKRPSKGRPEGPPHPESFRRGGELRTKTPTDRGTCLGAPSTKDAAAGTGSPAAAPSKEKRRTACLYDYRNLWLQTLADCAVIWKRIFSSSSTFLCRRDKGWIAAASRADPISAPVVEPKPRSC